MTDNCCYVNEVKAINLFVIPGGGLSGVLYAHGIFKSLHNAGLLLTADGELNYDNVFIASSGGTITAFLVLTCIHLELHKSYPDNWFEKFVESVIHKIDTEKVLSLYGLSQLTAMCVENLNQHLIKDVLYQMTNTIIIDIAPSEFKNKLGIDFKNGPFKDHFKFNYITVKNGNVPYMTDDNTDLTGQTILEQFKCIVRSSCTINGISYTRFYQNHDAAMYIPSYINCLSKYLENPYLRNILFFTITSFDEYSYDKLIFKNSFNINERDQLETNYFLIQYYKSECSKYNKNFKLINPPNKFYTIQKFNVALYNDLQQRMHYENDYLFIERFSGFFLFSDNYKMCQIVSLFGYYECLYALKQTNKTNKQKRNNFKNINYEYLSTLVYDPVALDVIVGKSSCKQMGLFQLHKSQTVQTVMDIIDYKHIDGKSVLEQCFHNYNGKRSNNILILKEYLTYMQGYIYDGDLKGKYKQLLPIQKGTNKKIWNNPEKYLNDEYKFVSKNCVSIYFPNTFL
jgi:hypothetical protein